MSIESAGDHPLGAELGGGVPPRAIDVSGALTAPESEGFSTLLTEMLAAGLDSIYVVGSGSEANDLALRIARYATGGKGIVTTRRAFHGTTVETAAISPAVGGLAAVAGWVRLVDPPIGDGATFAAAVRSAAYELRDSEYGFAGMIVDPVFTSDGVHPAAGLIDAGEAVRDAGGLMIVDETGGSLASVGPSVWAFEDSKLTPDILTFLATSPGELPIAVVTTRSTIDTGPALTTSRFRATDAALASAERALASIRTGEAGLESKTVGDYLAAGVALIASAGTVVSGVRGRGLRIGFDSGRSDELLDALGAAGVIAGRAGPDTLLIHAPLGFSMADADALLERMYSATLSIETAT